MNNHEQDLPVQEKCNWAFVESLFPRHSCHRPLEKQPSLRWTSKLCINIALESFALSRVKDVTSSRSDVEKGRQKPTALDLSKLSQSRFLPIQILTASRHPASPARVTLVWLGMESYNWVSSDVTGPHTGWFCVEAKKERPCSGLGLSQSSPPKQPQRTPEGPKGLFHLHPEPTTGH